MCSLISPYSWSAHAQDHGIVSILGHALNYLNNKRYESMWWKYILRKVLDSVENLFFSRISKNVNRKALIQGNVYMSDPR